MHLLSPDHEAALRDPLTWRDNPFIRREAQRDRKRKQPYKQLAWMSAFLLILCGIPYWFLGGVITNTKTVPWFVGGDLGTAVCALIAGIHVYYVMGSSTKHTLTLFTQEAARQTLSHLLLLPISAFQLLLQTMVYPWLVAMRTAVFLLPIYVFCVGLGGVSWGDVLMLYFVFGIVALSVPVWRRPALSDAVASGQVSLQPPQQNSMGIAGAASGAQNQTNPNAAAGGQASNNGQGGWTMLLVIPMMISFFTAMASGKGIAGWYTELRSYVPDSVLVLMPTAMFTWPLMLARAFVSPFDWYGFGIIPLPFVLFSTLGGRYLQLARTAEYLQVGTYRDLALLPTYQRRRRWEAIFRIANLFVVIGYLWKWLIWRGGLASIAGNTTSGLEGFLFIVLLVGSWTLLWRAGMVGRWLGAYKIPENATVLGKLQFATTLRFLLTPVAQALTLFALCCLVGHTSPFTASLFALGGKMLAIGFAGAVCAVGSTRIFGIFTYLGLVIVPLAGYDPRFQPLLNFSPTYCLFSLSKIALRGVTGGTLYPIVWGQAALAMALPGLLLTSLAYAILRQKRRKFAEPINILQLDPAQYGLEIWADATTVTATTNAKTESPTARRMVQAIQKIWDNAVGIKELRVGWRGKFSAKRLQSTFLTYLVISGVGVFGIPVLVTGFGSGIAESTMGRFNDAFVGILASLLGCWFIPLFFTAAATGLSLFLAYAGERDKSTLGFLLMTPMRPVSIVTGKIVGMMTGAGASVILLGAWTLFLALLLTALSGRPSPLLAWAGVMGTSLVIALTLGLFSLALASIFWKAARPAMFGWLWAIGIQVMIQSGNIFRAVFSFFLGMETFDTNFWTLMVVAYVLIMALLFGLCIWGIRRMRKGDIAFMSKRDN